MEIKDNVPNVLVIMATYNGSDYISDQIDSILSQESVNVNLIINDDKSSDDTVKICRKYARSYKNISLHVNETNLGIAENFLQSLYADYASKYDYIAFSDQDDVWLPEKLIKGIEYMQKTNTQPTLYFSEVNNVNQNLQNPKPSLGVFRGYEKRSGTALLRVWAHGCTMILNQKMRSIICSYRPEVIPANHDTWVYRVSACCGTIVADYDHSYILRRLHGDNEVGDVLGNFHNVRNFFSAVRMLFSPSTHERLKYALLIYNGYSKYLHAGQREALEVLINYQHSIVDRLKICFSPEFKMPTVGTRLSSLLQTLLRRW